MENPPVTLLQAWTPTLITIFLFVFAGILLGVKIDREDRRTLEEQKRKTRA